MEHTLLYKKLESRIMRRVYFIWTARKMVSPRAFKAYALVAFSFALVSSVSVTNVIANAPEFSNVAKNIRFFVNATTGTDTAVQLLLIGIFLAVVLLLRDFTERELRGVTLRA